MRPLLPKILPARFFYGGDRLTYSGRRLLTRAATVTGALGLLVLAVLLLDESITNEVLAGACFAWGVALLLWSIVSYLQGTEEVERNVYEAAKYQVLHERLNALASALGAPEWDLSLDLPDAVATQMNREAHLSGLDEFRDPIG